MAQSNCIVCGNAFKYRKGKVYCSDSCKSRAYQSRVSGIPIAVSIDPGKEYTQERKCFYLEDYEAWTKKDFDFQMYCFLIKSFPESEDVNFLNDYVSEIVNGDSFNDGYQKEGHPIYRSFLKFQELFYAGHYQIKKARDLVECKVS